jgi:hypothetical protein
MPAVNKIRTEELFRSRQALMASMHGKEKALVPVFKKNWNIDVVPESSVDTDQLGTFTGETERWLTPKEAAIKKCHLALDAAGHDLAIATEGSFGPHPQMPFLPFHEEWIALVDRRNNLEICLVERSMKTNYGGAWIESPKELHDFLARIGFPFHGLILGNAFPERDKVVKGITNWSEARHAYMILSRDRKKVYAESDMRAMFNPSRMLVIAKLGRRLTEAMHRPCPVCHKPGFAHQFDKAGLPCSQCGYPTQTTAHHIYTCQHCAFEEAIPTANEFGDPSYCLICNP